jgi:hypothetical protein
MKKKRDTDWLDDGIHPIKGRKGDADFLRENYKLIGPGCSFRTVKAHFSTRQIRASAEKAGCTIEIKDESPWLKITVLTCKPIPFGRERKKPNVFS